MLGIFASQCKLCFAETNDLYSHTAWHILEDHNITEEYQALIKEAAEGIRAEAQRQYDETIAKTKESDS